MDERPIDRIRRHQAELHELSATDLLARLEALAPLPDADDLDPAWNDDATLSRAEWLVAFGDEIGDRRMVDGIRPLFKRASLGDAYQMMLSLPHVAEHAVAGDWDRLTAIMRELAGDERSGTRRWAIRELGRLRNPASIEDLVAAALDDQEALVREEAFISIQMLADLPDARVRERARITLLRAAESDPSLDLRFNAADMLADLDPNAAAPLRRPPPPEPFSDPVWKGDVSGRAGAEATRRVVRSLITGALTHSRIDEYLRETGRQLAMTPGSGVYPPREPEPPPDGSAPTWRASIVLWTTDRDHEGRVRSPLSAEIELRRAGKDEVRARLLDVVT